jgi:hypothetical protein
MAPLPPAARRPIVPPGAPTGVPDVPLPSETVAAQGRQILVQVRHGPGPPRLRAGLRELRGLAHGVHGLLEFKQRRRTARQSMCGSRGSHGLSQEATSPPRPHGRTAHCAREAASSRGAGRCDVLESKATRADMPHGPGGPQPTASGQTADRVPRLDFCTPAGRRTSAAVAAQHRAAVCIPCDASANSREAAPLCHASGSPPSADRALQGAAAQRQRPRPKELREPLGQEVPRLRVPPPAGQLLPRPPVAAPSPQSWRCKGRQAVAWQPSRKGYQAGCQADTDNGWLRRACSFQDSAPISNAQRGGCSVLARGGGPRGGRVSGGERPCGPTARRLDDRGPHELHGGLWPGQAAAAQAATGLGHRDAGRATP